MSEPVNRRGEWWQQRSDGVWLKWDPAAAHWVEQAGAAPPSDETPAPSGVPQWSGWQAGSQQESGYPSSDYGRTLPPGPQWRGEPLSPPPAAGYGVQTTVTAVLAGWWRRALAVILDGLLLGILLAVAFVVLAVALGETDRAVAGDDPSESFQVAMLVTLGVLNFVVAPSYYTLFHGGRSGATLGKRILGLRVADSLTGAPIGYGRAFLRWLVSAALWWVLYIGGFVDALWPL